MTEQVALVAGARGIIGKALIEELAGTKDWRARGLSRNPLEHVEHIAVDLLDAGATARALAAAKDTTHLFYAAYSPRGDLAQEDEVNAAMLRNLLDGLSQAGAPLERVVLYQGAKIYGVHLGPVPSPFYEDDNPPHLGPNFYQSQEAELKQRHADGGPDWSILRPDVVVGDAAGNAMNIATVIGAYAAICRAQGAPFRFPGSETVYRHVLAQFTDARSLARASLWAATANTAKGQAFNYVHEPFRWERIWTAVGEAFDLPVGPPLPLTLAKHMPLQKSLWDGLMANAPSAPAYDEAVGWGFGDFVFGAAFDVVSDMGKIRRAGFNETVDSADALIEAIRRQQAAGILPK
jgi:nucleoside-diphosphate-sugar epimerase